MGRHFEVRAAAMAKTAAANAKLYSRHSKEIYMAAKAGGDIIVTGTVVEEVNDVQAKIQELTGAIKKASLE